jgi:hypothetical protein
MDCVVELDVHGIMDRDLDRDSAVLGCPILGGIGFHAPGSIDGVLERAFDAPKRCQMLGPGDKQSQNQPGKKVKAIQCLLHTSPPGRVG